MRWAMVLIWVTTALAATVAASIQAERLPRVWTRRLVVLAVGGPLFVVTAWLAGSALELVLAGDGNAPGGQALAALALHIGGLTLLAAVPRRPAWASAPVPWTSATILGLALTALLFAQLERRARQLAAQLRLEGSELARELLAAPPEPEQDAWPRYVALATRLEREMGEREIGERGPGEARDVLAAGRFDPADAEMRARLERLGPILAEARAATALPECDFAARRRHSTDDSSDSGAGVMQALALARAFALEGSLRAESGDVDGALDDAQALVALSRHAVASPRLIDFMVAFACREHALDVLGRVLLHADAARRERVATLVPDPLAASAGRALDLELAWGLSAVGKFGVTGRTPVGSEGLAPSRLLSGLYLVFHFEADVAGYRAAMAECRGLAIAPLAELRAELARGDDVRSAEAWRRGLMAVAAGTSSHLVLQARRTDARFALVNRALEALASDAEAARVQGRWTAEDPGWGDDPPVFELGPRR